jgi:membrane-associated phospholipid phosphatase
MTRSNSSILISVALFLSQVARAQDPGAGGSGTRDPDSRLAEQCVSALTNVIVHDITSPPVASRDYAYSLIAFYEAVRPSDSAYASFGDRLNGLQALPAAVHGLSYDWMVAGATAFYRTAYAFVFSKDLFQQSWDSIDLQLRKRPVSPEVYARSVEFGEQVARHILDWSKQDNYIHTRTLPRFTAGKKPGVWQQTGPEYMEAVEPYWNQIRPMTLTKAGQFLIPEPSSFNSQGFEAEKKEVAETTRTLTDDQRAIAGFWDCNPFAVQTIGHLMYSVKKISPGGHWIGITGLVINQEKQHLVAALRAYSFVSIALFDGFIAAWDEKYKTNYIRPITAIQQSFAPTWEPLLQTPPFPEYPSAHSVISMATAVVLTALYGDSFRYTDGVEEPFGLRPRAFRSFIEAANEAALSRLYGGIHFREAIENGKVLGKDIGEQIVAKFGLDRRTR